MKFQNYFILLLIITLNYSSCTYVLEDIKLNETQQFLVVDAELNNQFESQSVKLSYSRTGLTNSSVQEPIDDAKVWVQEENGNRIDFEFTDRGTYSSAKYAGTPGKSYQLNFELKNGNKYQSVFETMPASVPIDSIIVSTSVDTRFPLENSRRGGFDVYAQLKDTKGTEQFYQWSYERYRKIFWCQSCGPQEIWYNSINACGFNSILPPTQKGGPRIYPCEGDCWQRTESENIVILSDELVDGNKIKKDILRLPYLFETDDRPSGIYFMILTQKSITKNAYQFLKNFKEKTENTGSLFDLAPNTNFNSNINNLNKTSEKILGLFKVSSISKKTMRLQRNVKIENSILQFQPEPGEPACAPPYTQCTIPCIESLNRSKTPPPGWVN